MTLFRTSFARLTLLYMMVLALVGTAILYWSYREYLTQSRHNIEHLIDTDMAGLISRYYDIGDQALIRHISSLLTLTNRKNPQQIYLFLSPEGNKLAGNLEKWPDNIATNSKFLLFNSQSNQKQQTFAKATSLSKGYKILVGRNATAYNKLETNLFNILLIGFGIFLVTGLAIGFLASRSFLRRINRLNQLCEDVERGNITARIHSDGQDEIDHLGGKLNNMLNRISDLITLHKDTVDNIAHEIRSPLTRLNAIIEQGEKKQNISVDTAELVRGQIRDSVALLDQLLDISRIEARESDRSAFIDINFSHLLQNITELYHPLAEEKSLTLSVRISDNVHFTGLEQNLSRLCANLIDNALKFARTKIDISLEGHDANFTLSIHDDGPGIPLDLQDRIFLRFTKGKHETQTGVGLGMALVKAIADQHNLAIHIESSQQDTSIIVQHSAK